MAYLPLHIMENILLRLPVKSMLRCRCVCKAWCMLISHPQFAKTHLQLPQTQAKTRLCIIKYEEEKDDACMAVRVSTKDWESIGDGDGDGDGNDELLDGFDYSFGTANLKHHLRLLNSCDGLLCLVDMFGEFVLWNPSTRQYNPLPPNPNGPQDTAYGLGYDPSTDDYKIVGYHSLGYETMVDVFSLKSREWRRLQERHGSQVVSSGKEAVLHGAVHWIARDLNPDHYTVIVAFDFEKEEFRQMTAPWDDESYYILSVMGGCLCAQEAIDGSKIWVMKEYGVEASWTRNDLDDKFKSQLLLLDMISERHDWFRYDTNVHVETLVSPYPSKNE